MGEAMEGRAARLWILTATLLGWGVALYPFLVPPRSTGGSWAAHAADAPLFTGVLGILCLGIALQAAANLSSQGIAVVGLLTALTALLRFLPGPGGVSGIYLLPILVGRAYGAELGFLVGALGTLASALMGGGVGPWLPFQMLGVGWIGLGGGLLPLPRGTRGEVVGLALWGAASGYLFGLWMTLWFWPYLGPGRAGFWAYYLATSLLWDGARVAANLGLLLLTGGPLLRVLRRHGRRFRFHTTDRGSAGPTPGRSDAEGP